METLRIALQDLAQLIIDNAAKLHSDWGTPVPEKEVALFNSLRRLDDLVAGYPETEIDLELSEAYRTFDVTVSCKQELLVREIEEICGIVTESSSARILVRPSGTDIKFTFPGVW